MYTGYALFLFLVSQDVNAPPYPGISINSTEKTVSLCELHIWPTLNFYAYFNGATVYWNGVGPNIQIYQNSMDRVARKLSISLSPSSQEDTIRAIDFDKYRRTRGYKIVFHPAQAKTRFMSVGDPAIVGQGPRESDSKSICYSEIHVNLVTLDRTSLTKKIMTSFMYRDFGRDEKAKFSFRFGGTFGAPGFETNGNDPKPEEIASLKAAFRLGLERMLKYKSMQ